MGIEDIYKMLINGLDLTDITLEQYGFTKEDINNLIINKQLRIVNNTYDLVSVKKFFTYGVSLLRSKNLSSANACFYRCYELNSHIKEVCLQVLMMELKRQRGRNIKEYEKIFDIFTNLETITPKKHENNNDLYLYLFGFILEDMPSNYKERISNMKSNNLMLDNKSNNKEENEIRKAILKRKFKYAIKLLDNLIRKQNGYSVRYELLRTLLNEVIDAEVKFNNKLLYLVKKGNYEEIINILEKRRN